MKKMKKITLTFPQATIFKLAMFSAGLAVGAIYAHNVMPYVASLLAVAIIGGGYVSYTWWQD